MLYLKFLWKWFRNWLGACYLDMLKSERERMDWWESGYKQVFDPDRVVGPFTENMRGLSVTYYDGAEDHIYEYEILGPFDVGDMHRIRLVVRRCPGGYFIDMRDVDLRVDVVRYATIKTDADD